MGTMESFLIERYFRQSFIAKKTLEIEQDVLDKELERSKQILCNILPSIFVEELSETSDTGALLLSRRPLKLFKDVTILISDIVNFTTWSSTKTSEYVVHMLNTQFSALDQLASDMGLEKVKTVGDSWICCGNLTSNDNDAGLKMVELGMSMLEEINRLNRERGWFIQLRIGIAKGDIYSGVIGVSKQSFDCYGPAVEIAHLMESNSQPDTVQVNDTLLPDIEEHYTYKPHTFNSDTGWITGYFITGEKDDMIEQTIEEIEAELRAETPSLSPRSDQELIEKESIKHVPVYKQTQVLYKLNKWIMMFPTVKQNIEVFRYTFPGLLNVYKAVVVVQTGTFMYLVGVDIMNYETSIDSGNMIVEYVTMVTYTFVLILYCTPLSSRFPLFTVVVIVLTVVANFIIGISTTINSALEPSILGKVSLAIIMYV
jgi:class 3 adenylate cyclase